MQQSNAPSKIYVPFAQNDSSKVNVPVTTTDATRASQSLGFPPLTGQPPESGGVPPQLEDFNGAINQIASIAWWVMGGNFYPYDATFAASSYIGGYANGAKLLRLDNTGDWLNTVDNNVTNPDATDGTAANWTPGYNYGAASIAVSSTAITVRPVQAAKRILILTGTLSANTTVTLPAWVYEWTIINNTAMVTFTLLLNTASGTGVYLQAGAQSVHGDGTNIVQAPASIATATASQQAATLGQVQSGLSSYAIDTGTANTYAVPLSPAIAAYADGVKIRFRALTANTGAATLNVNGLGAIALVGGAQIALQGGEIAAGGYCEAEYNGSLSKFVLLECTGAPVQVANATASQHAVPLGQAQSLIAAAQTPQLMPLTASVASNLITANLAAVSLEFRNATLTTGSGTTIAVTALSVAIPNIAASLGATTAVAAQIAVLVAYNTGSPVLCLVNMSGGVDLSETGTISPTTISAGSTSPSVIYSASAVAANSPYRVVGYFTGTWTSGTGWALTQVQPYGGQAMAAMQSLGFGQTWQDVTASRTFGVTYYNTTNRAIVLNVQMSNNGNSQVSATINGGLAVLFLTTANVAGQFGAGSIVIPARASYLLTSTTVNTINQCAELR